jgi:hypothetical protein
MVISRIKTGYYLVALNSHEKTRKRLEKKTEKEVQERERESKGKERKEGERDGRKEYIKVCLLFYFQQLLCSLYKTKFKLN